jgi:hypothetical protein
MINSQLTMFLPLQTITIRKFFLCNISFKYEISYLSQDRLVNKPLIVKKVFQNQQLITQRRKIQVVQQRTVFVVIFC